MSTTGSDPLYLPADNLQTKIDEIKTIPPPKKPTLHIQNTGPTKIIATPRKPKFQLTKNIKTFEVEPKKPVKLSLSDNNKNNFNSKGV